MPHRPSSTETAVVVARLAARADAAVAQWKARFAGPLPRRDATSAPGAPAILLAELRREAEAVGRDHAAVARQAAEEAVLASDWERRAMRAVEMSSDDLARQALARHAGHADAAAALGEEAAFLGAIVERYQEMIARLEGPRPSGPTATD